MTAFLSCDGCGNIVQERQDNGDETLAWWCLTPAPSPSANFFPAIKMEVGSFNDDDPEIRTWDGQIIGGEPEQPTIFELPPPAHFCQLHCLLTWVQRKLVET